MSNPNRIFTILSELRSNVALVRDQAASEAADYFEAGQLSENQYRTLVYELLTIAASEADRDAKDSIFNALSSASMSAMAQAINWDPIALVVDDLDVNCLEHALVILGFSRQSKYRKTIERFVRHPDRDIGVAATEALEENKATLARRSV